MKASHFVAIEGWDKAILIVEKALHIGMFKFAYIGSVNSDELEFLVESKQLLQAYGSDKDGFIANYCKDRQLDPKLSDVYALVERQYNQIIADVDSCKEMLA